MKKDNSLIAFGVFVFTSIPVKAAVYADGKTHYVTGNISDGIFVSNNSNTGLPTTVYIEPGLMLQALHVGGSPAYGGSIIYMRGGKDWDRYDSKR